MTKENQNAFKLPKVPLAFCWLEFSLHRILLINQFVTEPTHTV